MYSVCPFFLARESRKCKILILYDLNRCHFGTVFWARSEGKTESLLENIFFKTHKDVVDEEFGKLLEWHCLQCTCYVVEGWLQHGIRLLVLLFESCGPLQNTTARNTTQNIAILDFHYCK